MKSCTKSLTCVCPCLKFGYAFPEIYPCLKLAYFCALNIQIKICGFTITRYMKLSPLFCIYLPNSIIQCVGVHGQIGVWPKYRADLHLPYYILLEEPIFLYKIQMNLASFTFKHLEI